MNRRQFVAGGAGAAALAQAQSQAKKKTVAAIATMYADRISHGKAIFGKMFNGYSPNGVFTEPRTRIVSMYTHQAPADDLSRSNAPKFGYTVYPSIKDAMTLGGNDLAVDAVCLVGEHGDYPWNGRGQHLYPRYELMEPIVEVFRRTGKVVPVFYDKHFSYSWWKARQIYGWSRELHFPFMAGSSIPVTPRNPFIEIPYGAGIEHAVATGFANVDAYGFHTLEALQCMIERRKGGETGIRSVEWIEGDDVWRWRDGQGRWSVPLLEAAFASNSRTKPGRVEDNVKEPVLFVLEYNDGLRAAAFILNGHTSCFSFAGRVKGSEHPVATYFEEHTRAGVNFDGMVHCMEEMFVTGKPQYPVERTMLTTCTLSFLFESRVWKRRLETPELNIAYRAPRDIYVQRS